MTISAAEFNTMWILLPSKIDDNNKIVYRKCRVKELRQNVGKWTDEIYATYAEFENSEVHNGFVILEDVKL